DLKVLAQSEESGIFLIEDSENQRFYVLNHLEYEADTLKREYDRDVADGTRPHLPHNYFPDNDPALPPRMTWRSHRTLLFSNWINIVYQGTPYNLDEI
ncbi:MAG: homoserine O-succinyltransferase, partial [Akkermansiaceae bacterium]|nr:homoserine O-succinyltransferase [Akkermansiaceae bacterium]